MVMAAEMETQAGDLLLQRLLQRQYHKRPHVSALFFTLSPVAQYTSL